MVVKIQKPIKDPRVAVNYNEDKMHEIEKGVILGTRNVPEDKSIVDVYKEREMLARFNRTRGQQIKNVSFHMSVNPSETDEKIGDEGIVSMVDKIMKDLGYADQPYKIYKHTDIARTHYHVVSCRIDGNGRKIPADFERIVLQNTLHKLEKEYGFKVGISNEEPELETAQEEGRVTNYAPEPVRKTAASEEKQDTGKKPIREKPAFVRSFHQYKGAEPATIQMKNIFEDAIKWNFSTFEQMQALMLRRYNVLLERKNAEGESESAVISGLRPNGTVAMKPLTEEELGLRMLERIRRRIEESNMSSRREQRKRREAHAGGRRLLAKQDLRGVPPHHGAQGRLRGGLLDARRRAVRRHLPRQGHSLRVEGKRDRQGHGLAQEDRRREGLDLLPRPVPGPRGKALPDAVPAAGSEDLRRRKTVRTTGRLRHTGRPGCQGPARLHEEHPGRTARQQRRRGSGKRIGRRLGRGR